MRAPRPFVRFLTVLAATTVLSACGGSGGDTARGTVAPPARPTDSFPSGAGLRLTIADPIGTAFADSALITGETPTVTLSARTADGSALALPDTLAVRWTSSVATVLNAPSGTSTSGTLTAAVPGAAQLTASVTLRQNGAPVTATASVSRAVRAESLTVFTLAAPPTVRTYRAVALTLDVRGRRGTPVAPAGLTLTSSAPGVVPAPSVPPGATSAAMALSTTAGGTGGTATLTAQAMGRTAAVAIVVTPPPVPIELVFEAGAPQVLQAAFREAADRWEDVFTAALPAAGAQHIPANACGLNTPGVMGTVPGIRVFVSLKSDDQLPTAAAIAAPCGGGSTGLAYGARPVVLTILGGISIRSSLASGSGLPSSAGQPPVYLVNLGVHELGHVLGIGTQWNAGTRVDRSDATDYRLHTPLAMQAFVAAGGTLAGAKATGVPLEMAAGAQGHWRTSVFVPASASEPNEVMDAVAVSTAGQDRLSAITLGALADLGYPVSLAAADPYTVPAVGSGSGVTGPTADRLVGSAARAVVGRVRPGDARLLIGDDVRRP